MPKDSKTAKERYREKTKRVSIDEWDYYRAKKYIEERKEIEPDKSDPRPLIAKSENRVISNIAMMALSENCNSTSWLDRVLMFAERNDMTEQEAIQTIVCSTLDESGHVEETFRKTRLYPNELW